MRPDLSVQALVLPVVFRYKIFPNCFLRFSRYLLLDQPQLGVRGITEDGWHGRCREATRERSDE